MSLRPVDLNTLYSQLDRAAGEAARQTQGAQIASAMRNDTAAQKLQEQRKTVEQTQKSERDVSVKDGGASAAGGQGGGRRKRGEGEKEKNGGESAMGGYFDPSVGRLIDRWI